MTNPTSIASDTISQVFSSVPETITAYPYVLRSYCEMKRQMRAAATSRAFCCAESGSVEHLLVTPRVSSCGLAKGAPKGG